MENVTVQTGRIDKINLRIHKIQKTKNFFFSFSCYFYLNNSNKKQENSTKDYRELHDI